MPIKSALALAITACTLWFPQALAQPGVPTVSRLNNGQPIITEQMFRDAGATPREGNNINGPSVLRLPDWLPASQRAHPSAVYYMYFANHLGHYIRLAYAENIEGPWRLHGTGSKVPVGRRGVLDLGANVEMPLANGLTLNEHVASPEVLIDDENRRFIMYFHGPYKYKDAPQTQKTFVATSPDGLHFNDRVEPVTLGRAYFRVFNVNSNLYAFANNGDLYKARDAKHPWTPPANLDFATDLWQQRPDNPFLTDLEEAGIEQRPRHTTVRIFGETMYVFYTRLGGVPERLMVSTIDLAEKNFETWDPSFPPAELMRAERSWEGADIAPGPSTWGAAPEDVNQIRDPYYFEDADGRAYVFYSARGEDAIGVAEIFFGAK